MAYEDMKRKVEAVLLAARENAETGLLKVKLSQGGIVEIYFDKKIV